MTARGTQFLLLATLLVTMPSPVYALLCAGLLPVFTQMLLMGRILHHFDPVLAVAMAGSIVLGTAISYWVAWIVARRIGPKIVLYALMPAILVLGAVPLYSFDCMDGHAYTACSAYRIYLEMFVGDNACGDVG
jgi:hypothetical protein